MDRRGMLWLMVKDLSYDPLNKDKDAFKDRHGML